MRIFVPGIPVAKGSAKAFVIKSKASGKHRAIVTQTNSDKQKPWASSISYHAQVVCKEMFVGPVAISLEFIMPRNKGHYGTGTKANTLKPSAPSLHTVKPDLDKLTRCVLDALTNIVWKDDCQVCEFTKVTKTYGDNPGVFIEVRPR